VTPRAAAGTPRRWGLDVRWGSVRGAVAFRDPGSGEWVEVERRWLRSDNPKTDLAWMRRRVTREDGK
jgi:hypothetical protein